ncbi:MAG: polysaccharide deacetylase family protein [Candidatus Omnitrophota bacterium]
MTNRPSYRMTNSRHFKDLTRKSPLVITITMKKISLLLFSAVILLVVFYFSWLSPRHTVPILMYHNIACGKGGSFVSPENFTRQMEYIKKKNYEVISLDELVESIKNKKHLKKNKVVITFDDGYKDNFEYAYPVLKKFGFPAVIFLITDWIGNNKEILTWDKIIAMSKNGVSFGGHTKSHLYLGSVNDKKTAMEEIAGSKETIEQKIGLTVDYFSYPIGGFNKIVEEAVIEAGYKGACTTNRGLKFNNIYALKRIKVTNSDTTKPFSFWAKLSGYYNLFRSRKKSN